MKTLMMLIVMSFQQLSAHEAGETEAQIGPGKAVEAFDSHKGIKLSAKAQKTLGIETMKATGKSHTVGQNAVLLTQDKSSVFVKHDGWFKIIPVKVQSNGQSRIVSSKDIHAGDEIVVGGVALLRVAYMNVAEAEEEHENEDEDEPSTEEHGSEKEPHND